MLSHEGLHLFPSHPDAYILITTSGKAFSNLPEFTWPDYNKMASALPMSVQNMQPIPPIPQLRQQPHVQPPAQRQPIAQQAQYQQSYQQQQPMSHNCCQPAAADAPYSGCSQHTTHSSMSGMAPAFMNALGAPFGSHSAPVNISISGQQSGFANGVYTGGPVYR
jgi:hypothetical protein